MGRKHVLRAGAMAVMFLLAGPSAAHAQSVTCESPVTIEPMHPISTSGGGGVTVNRFDFSGTVTLCLADGTRVPGTLAGSAVQIVRPDGSGRVVVRETLTISDDGGGVSTLNYVALARFTPSTFEGTIHTTSGTGDLSRVRGQGTFFPTAPPTGPVGPTTFFSTILFEYY